MRARVEHGVFGYSAPPEALRQAIVERLARRYGWRGDPAWFIFLPGVVPGLHVSARRVLGRRRPAPLSAPPSPPLKRAPRLAPRRATQLPPPTPGGRAGVR